MKKLFLVPMLVMIMIFSACSQESSGLENGYYTAEAASFDSHGWKEYITIYVSGNKIITVEYNAYNASGFIKSWDMNYMRVMKQSSGTYPNEYTRAYAVSLLNWQDSVKVDVLAGATHSHVSFQLLAEAAIARARTGNKEVAFVEFTEN